MWGAVECRLSLGITHHGGYSLQVGGGWGVRLIRTIIKLAPVKTSEKSTRTPFSGRAISTFYTLMGWSGFMDFAPGPTFMRLSPCQRVIR